MRWGLESFTICLSPYDEQTTSNCLYTSSYTQIPRSMWIKSDCVGLGRFPNVLSLRLSTRRRLAISRIPARTLLALTKFTAVATGRNLRHFQDTRVASQLLGLILGAVRGIKTGHLLLTLPWQLFNPHCRHRSADQ